MASVIAVDETTPGDEGLVLVGYQHKETGQWKPAFTTVSLQVVECITNLDPIQFRWFMGNQWYHYPELVATTTGKETAKVLVPLGKTGKTLRDRKALPANAAIGISAYSTTQNDEQDGRQTVQTQVGTGWLTLQDVYWRLQDQGKSQGQDECILVPIINEATHTECTLKIRVLRSDHPWILEDSSEKDEEQSVVLSSSQGDEPPLIPASEALPDFYKVDALQPYRRIFVGSIFPANPSEPSKPARLRIPMWMYLMRPGEVRTPEAFYVRAADHALAVCGLTRDQFLAKPDLEVLVQVLGFFAWSCPYQVDREAVGHALYDQCGCIREIPNAGLRAGDCEDLAREMFLVYWWLREKGQIHDPVLQQLQQWVHHYCFVFVDVKAENDILHAAARLVPIALCDAEWRSDALDTPSRVSSEVLPILFLEPTERVWATRHTPSALEAADHVSTSTRTLHPFAKVKDWYVQDLAYYCDEWEEVRAPVREGLHPSDFRGTFAPQPWYAITEAYKAMAEWVWNHQPPVPILSLPFEIAGTPPLPTQAHQCIYLQSYPGSNPSEQWDQHTDEVFRDTVMTARLYDPDSKTFQPCSVDRVRALVHRYPLLVAPQHCMYCVYVRLSDS